MQRVPAYLRNLKLRCYDLSYVTNLSGSKIKTVLLTVFNILSKKHDFARPDTLVVVDPVLGDNGALYGCFTDEFVTAMRALCADAQLITPNHTEAALLAGCAMDAGEEELLSKLTVPNVIITSVRRGDQIGYAARLNGEYMELFRPCLPQTLHGTGDVFVSALCGELMSGRAMPDALSRAADFCDRCVRKTAARGEDHWYGLAFEDVLKEERNL